MYVAHINIAQLFKYYVTFIHRRFKYLKSFRCYNLIVLLSIISDVAKV
jgi:hypothetical protein